MDIFDVAANLLGGAVAVRQCTGAPPVRYCRPSSGGMAGGKVRLHYYKCTFSLSVPRNTLMGVFFSVYYIRDDIKENPYGAVHVVWLQQERGTNHWLYSFCQTDIGKYEPYTLY